MAEGGLRNQGRDDHGPEYVQIMTLNIGKGKNVDIRRPAVESVLEAHPQDIVCLQEWDFKGDFPAIYNDSKNNDSKVGILWNKKKFKEVDKKCIQEQMDSFFSSHGVTSFDEDHLANMIKCLCLEEAVNVISTRSCVVKLQRKDTNAKVIVISYHGRRKDSNQDDKKGDIVMLQMLAKYLSDKNKYIPVVIGGDFNLNSREVRVCNEFTVRRKGEDLLDYFIITNDTEITGIQEITNTKEIKHKKSTWSKLKDIFGHTAIFGRLISDRERIEQLEGEVKGLTERIEKLEGKNATEDELPEENNG